MNAQPQSVGEDPEEGFGDELPRGTQLLRGQYTISRFLNAGGFGITYLAKDSLDRAVVIKECFPSSMCCRRNHSVAVRSRTHQKDFESIVNFFGQEARALAKLKHPSIVGVHQVFEDNHTAYMALDFVKGMDLLDIIDQHPDRLDDDTIRELLKKLLSAVAYIHDNGILHRDISPDNILVDEVANPVLIDFGAAREEASRVTRLLNSQHTVKDGYSPQEFYVAGAKQTPASDLYALAATFYHLITGEAPPVSQERLAAVAEKKKDPYVPLTGRIKRFDHFFLAAIDKCLAVFPDDRIRSAQEWSVEIDTMRRRAAAKQRAEDDEKMQLAISKLVSETNRDVAAGGNPEPVNKKRAFGRKHQRAVRQKAFDDLKVPAVENPVQEAEMTKELVASTVAPRKSILGRVFGSRWRSGSGDSA